MKKPLLTFSLPLLLLSACAGGETAPKGVAIGEMPSFEISAVANYYLNYGKEDFSIEGYSGSSDNVLYHQEKLVGEKTLTKPTDPERKGYSFQGWYLDKAGTEAFDFSVSVKESIFLFASWEKVSEQEEDYVEPKCVVQKKIDDSISGNLRVDAVLHNAVTSNVCYVTFGAKKRLEANLEDASFALNATYKTGTEITSCTYDKVNRVLKVVSKNGSNVEEVSINVLDDATDRKLNNTNYEYKAYTYEESDMSAENYHIMLAGSSSMEFWTEYKKDLDPIVAYNHGIGGTTAAEWRDSLVDRLVVPYSPKAVVYFAGVNDIINASTSAEDTANNVIAMLKKTHERLPETKVFYVYINVLPGWFEPYQQSIESVNATVKAFIEGSGNDWVDGIPAGESFLKENGKADMSYYRADNLHMSYYGYSVWGKKIKEALMAWMG